jgi:phospholipase D1/2
MPPVITVPDTRRRPYRLFAALGLALLLAAAWRWTPLHGWLDPPTLAAGLRRLRNSPWALPLVLLIYGAASATLFPNTVLNVAIILGFGEWRGLGYALAGSMTAALLTYAFGRRYGRERVARLDSRLLQRLSGRLERGGVLQITTLRLLPIAPFSLVNLGAGALQVRAWPFALGTLLGLLPGNLLVTAFGRQLRALLDGPALLDLAVLLALLLFGACALWALRRRALQG